MIYLAGCIFLVLGLFYLCCSAIDWIDYFKKRKNVHSFIAMNYFKRAMRDTSALIFFMGAAILSLGVA
jgi:hypothetical protein